jgi:hypothetical protein
MERRQRELKQDEEGKEEKGKEEEEESTCVFEWHGMCWLLLGSFSF